MPRPLRDGGATSLISYFAERLWASAQGRQQLIQFTVLADTDPTLKEFKNLMVLYVAMHG